MNFKQNTIAIDWRVLGGETPATFLMNYKLFKTHFNTFYHPRKPPT